MEKNKSNFHILPVSATMVGVCMTVISLVQIMPKNTVSSWVDGLLVLDSFVFIVSAYLSFWTIKHEKNAEKFESFADWLFLVGLVVMGVVSIFIAFDLFLN